MRPLAGERRVEGVVIENASGRAALRAKVVVDATGDASVAAASGVPCAGEDPELRHRRQPCTLVFRMSNVDVKRFRALPREEKRALALEGIRDGRIFWESLSFCSTPGGTDAVSLMSRIFDVDALDAADLTRAELAGRQQVKSIVAFLRERVPDSRNRCSPASRRASACARRAASSARPRSPRRTSSAASAFPTRSRSAPGRWTCTSRRAPGSRSGCPSSFEIPFGCLLPQSVEGLVVAGRAMSATREANGGSRHMGTAMCLGEAAGLYAALAARGSARLGEPPYEEIRRILRARGALVSVEDALAAARDASASGEMLAA